MTKMLLAFTVLALSMTEICRAAVGDYDLATGKSSVKFQAVGSPGGFKINGTSEEKAGVVAGTIARAGNGWTLKSSFLLNQLDTGLALRTSHMKENYLETKKFPEAKLLVDRFSAGSKVPFRGLLELHGRTRPVSGQIDMREESGKLSVNAEFTVTLEEFGIAVPSFAGVSVSPKIPISVEVSDAVSP